MSTGSLSSGPAKSAARTDARPPSSSWDLVVWFAKGWSGRLNSSLSQASRSNAALESFRFRPGA
eukprot:8263826-Pyramimonas_sp.AAC.1